MYIKIINGAATEYSIKLLRQDNPQVSFPSVIAEDVLATYDVYPCDIQDVVIDQLTQKKAKGQFVQIDGRWTMFMVAENLDQATAEENIREHRDTLLSRSDWRVIKAYEKSENLPAAWELYRQALRDISTQEGFPFNVTWPTEPA
jgi:hypothetical protein